MKKLLSYVLFGGEERFWNNIPYLLITNSFVYQDFHMKFFVHEDCIKSSLFSLLGEPARKFDNIEIEIVNEPVKGTKLTIWRMKPLWEDDVEYLFCRDIDYAITDLERKSVEYFIKQTDRSICSIRSYHLHTTPLMAGLCGFKVKEVYEKIKNRASSFAEYIDFGIKNVEYCKNWWWGCDQALLRDFFSPLLNSCLLDCVVQNAPKKVGRIKSKLCLPSEYDKVELPLCNKKVLEFGSSLSGFVGQPFICNSTQLKQLMDLDNNEMVEIFRKLFKDNYIVFGKFLEK